MHQKTFNCLQLGSRTFILLLKFLSTLTLLLCQMSSAFSSSSQPRVFVITGSTDGIGKHTAEKLASDGYGLIVHGRRSYEEVGKPLEEDLMSRGAAFVHYVRADLADLDDIRSLADVIKEKVDHIDVLVNNAGVFDPSDIVSKQGYETTWAVNVMAPFLLTRLLLPLIVGGSSNKPRIITTSSISQSSTLPSLDKVFATGEDTVNRSSHSTYSHSKLGDLMFTKKLAQILTSNNYDAKCLTMDPGTVNTKMLLAGWGPCGIPVKKANNTYKLAATKYGAEAENGSYHFGWGGSRDAEDQNKLDALWEALEKHTGCTYSNIGSSL